MTVLTPEEREVLKILDASPVGATDSNLITRRKVKPSTLSSLHTAGLVSKREHRVAPDPATRVMITDTGRAALNLSDAKLYAAVRKVLHPW